MDENTTRGLMSSGNIPIPEAGEIDAAYCLKLLYLIRDVVFSTVDAEGLPSSRVIDVMYTDERRLYFLAPRGKAFYAELMSKPYVAITGQTTDFRMCRLRGRVVHPTDRYEQRRLVDWLFALNPDMGKLYPGDTRYVIEVFIWKRAKENTSTWGKSRFCAFRFVLGKTADAALGEGSR